MDISHPEHAFSHSSATFAAIKSYLAIFAVFIKQYRSDMSTLRVRTILSSVDRSLLLPQRIGPQFLYVTHEPGDRLDKARGLSGRYPFHSEPVRVDPAVCE